MAGIAGRAVMAHASSGAFDPLSLSPAAWYDFSDAATVTTATGISQITDKSGNGLTLAQGTGGSQPAYTVASSNMNGLNCSTWTNHRLTNSSVIHAAQPNTVVAVFRRGSATGNMNMIDNITASTETTRQILSMSSTQYTVYAGSSLSATVTMDVGRHILTGVYNSTSSALYLDGAQIGSTGNAGTNTRTVISLGGPSTAGTGNAFTGDIGEVFFIPGTPSLTNLWAYLKAKWGTP